MSRQKLDSLGATDRESRASAPVIQRASPEARAAAPPEVEFAPAVLVRVAGWPMQALHALQDRELAGRALAADVDQPESLAAFEAVYADALRDARSRLWHQTCADPRFMRALTVSNPEFAARAGRLRRDATRNKRVRHAETSLYRYLARAVGRTEPCELWSGVALASWGARTSVRVARERVRFTPDLRPFQTLLRALARTPAYRTRGCFKPAVTLREHPDGRWSYWVRPAQGAAQRMWLQPRPGLHVLLGVVRALSAGSFDSLILGVCERIELPRASAQKALLALLDLGVLVGGLDLPGRFVSPWDALAQASALLDGEHRRAWLHAYRALRRICRRLAAALALTPAEIAEPLAAAAEIVTQLAAALELPCPSLPRVVLRADLRAGFDVTFGPEQRAQVERTLSEYVRHQAAYGVAHAARQTAIATAWSDIDARALEAAEPADACETFAVDANCWEEVAERLQNAPRVAERVGRWQQLLARDTETVTSRDGAEPEPASPFGCLLLAPSARGLTVAGLLDEFTPLYARYVRLWSPEPGPVDDPLLRWFRGAIRRVEHEAGVTIAALITPCEQNPNVLACPTFTDATVSPWTAREDAGELPLCDARLVRDTARGAPLLQFAGEGDAEPKKVAVFSFSSAHVAQDDALGQLLLTTAFRVVGLANLNAAALPFASELANPRSSPRIELASGAVVRTRRTVLRGAELEALLRATPAQRYARLQRLAARFSWSDVVRIRRDRDATLLIPISCPLAIEALFEGAAATRVLTVEDCDPPWLRAQDGSTFVAEMAVPFARTRHAWSPREVPHG